MSDLDRERKKRIYEELLLKKKNYQINHIE